jgi:hypothetical protein
MTKGARCRNIERLILEREDRPLEVPEARSIEDHLGRCADCRQFEAARRMTRNGLKDLSWPPLSNAIDLRTRQLLRDKALDMTPEDRRPEAGKARIPIPITVALVLVTVLTAVWLTLSLVGVGPFESLKSVEDLPLAARIALALIGQNVAVLLCTPVIMRAARAAQNEDEDIV